MVDPISDMITRIRNAQKAGHKSVLIPLSKIKLEIAKILKKEGYIEELKKSDKNTRLPDGQGKKLLELDLKFPAVISEIKRVSKPGQRIYVKADKIRQFKSGYGISVISTPKGLMTNKEARKAVLGGEVLLEVW